MDDLPPEFGCGTAQVNHVTGGAAPWRRAESRREAAIEHGRDRQRPPPRTQCAQSGHHLHRITKHKNLDRPAPRCRIEVGQAQRVTQSFSPVLPVFEQRSNVFEQRGKHRADLGAIGPAAQYILPRLLAFCCRLVKPVSSRLTYLLFGKPCHLRKAPQLFHADQVELQVVLKVKVFVRAKSLGTAKGIVRVQCRCQARSKPRTKDVVDQVVAMRLKPCLIVGVASPGPRPLVAFGSRIADPLIKQEIPRHEGRYRLLCGGQPLKEIREVVAEAGKSPRHATCHNIARYSARRP